MENTSVFQMYHGGVKWTRIPREILGSKKNRYEGGVGIYFTNVYNTAREYARGSNVVHLVDIDRNFKDITKVDLKLSDVVNFVSNCRGMKNKNAIIKDLQNSSSRRNVDFVGASVLNNLIVNHEAGAGNVGVEVSKYFISKGIDAYMDRHSGEEFWLVVFNPNIIKKVQIVNPKTITSDFKFVLPIY